MSRQLGQSFVHHKVKEHPGQRSMDQKVKEHSGQRSMDQKVNGAKMRLKRAIVQNVDTTAPLSAVVGINISLQDKLQSVDVSWIKNEQLICEEDIKHLYEVIKYMRDIGLCVCPQEGSTAQRPPIPAGDDSVFKHGSSLIQGSKFCTDVIRKLGYTEESDGQLTVNATMDADNELVAMVTADLMVLTEELDMYRSGRHPNPDKMAEVLPPGVRDLFQADSSNPIYENVANANHLQPMSSKQPVVLSNEMYDIEIPIKQTKPDSSKKPPIKLRPKAASFKSPGGSTAASCSPDGVTSVGPHLPHSPGGAARDVTDSPGVDTGANVIPSVMLATKSRTDAGIPPKTTPDDATRECELCGKCHATVSCTVCVRYRSLCDDCSKSWHQHATRSHHKVEPVVATKNILRPKPQTRKITPQADNRSSKVVFHGRKVSEDKVHSEDSTSHGKLSQPWIKRPVTCPTGQQDGEVREYATPRSPGEHVPLNMSSHDQVEDPAESLPVYNSTQSFYQDDCIEAGGPKTRVIPTTVQQFNSDTLKRELDKESDLHKRKLKVMDRMSEVDKRLGNIASGQERTSVLNRIGLLREQEFLKQYEADLDKRILEEDNRESRKSSKPGIKESLKQMMARMTKLLPSHAELKQTISCPESPEDQSIYYSDVDSQEALADGSSTSTASSGQSKSLRARLNNSKNSSATENTVSSEVYEDVEVRPVSRLPHSLPKVSPKQKENIRKTDSEPPPNKGSWDKGWRFPWACQHCTFHMKAGTRVCALCFKTSDKPVMLNPTNQSSRPLPVTPQKPADILKGKSVETMDNLDNIAALRKSHVHGLALNSHGEMLNKVDTILRNNTAGITYPKSHQGSLVSQTEVQRDLERQGRQLLAKLKDADNNKFTVEEFHIAYRQDNGTDPTHWLTTTWLLKVSEVITRATSQLQAIHQGAQLSAEEARVSLVQGQGDVSRAVYGAVSNWKQMYEELLTNLVQETVPTADDKSMVVKAVNDSHGDLSEASLILFREVKTPRLLDNIWQAEYGVYGNNEVSMMLPGQPGHDKPYEIIADCSISKQKRQRLLMAEFRLDTVEKARNVLILWDKRDQLPDNVTIVDVIEAIRNCGTILPALSYLQHVCAVCESKFPATKIQMLSFCQCKLCVGCMRDYFKLAIKEKQVRDLVCPMCRKPDISNQEEFEQHLQLLLLMLRHQLSLDDVELFEKKLRDWSLLQDPNFRWCSYDDCGCGFVFTRQWPAQLMMECPECARPTCYKCRKPWESEHSGQTCEQFELLKAAKNPTRLATGAAMLLQDTGIDCPKCGCRYGIAKGGCMHLTCSQCGHEFCSGCNKPFNRGAACAMLDSCARSGLHCHHPRSCLYYLRNEPITKLLKLLQEENINYLTSPPSGGSSKQTKCPVMETKDTNKDEPCGRPIVKHHAGLCQLHYSEYLVGLINRHGLDPVSMMGVDELRNQFMRVGHEIPIQTSGENLQLYKNRLLSLVKETIPLPTLTRHESVLSLHSQM